MQTSLQCLSKAIEFEALAAAAPTEVERIYYMKMCDAWRTLAAVAAEQDRWTDENP
jgi:hypothetical protein